MRTLWLTSVAACALAMSVGGAAAECGIDEGSVRILSNDFEALHVVAERAEQCASDTVEVTKNQTTEHKNIQVAALTSDPATYTVAVVANNSLVPLLNDGLVRPLDDLVAEYGQDLQESQLIRIDGKVMAIAFMANAQHLYYRSDLLEEAGLEPPKTYEDMLANAEALKAQGILETPLAASFKPGWDLAQEFVNMYTGFGGEFFTEGSAEAAIVNDQGVAALEMMKAMSEEMNPDFVTYDTNGVKPVWEASEVAMMNGWGSRTASFIDETEQDPVIAQNTKFAAAPTVGGGTVPATTLFWDGFAIAKNVSDADAEASFRAMVHAISPELLEEHSDKAVWLIEGYEPSPAAEGVVATLAAGAKPYPMTPYMGLLHTALGANLAEFMQGQESAQKALEDVVAAYNTAAREAGYLK